MQYPRNIARWKSNSSSQLLAQQLGGLFYVLFTIVDDLLFSILVPKTLTNILRYRFLLDVFPTLYSVGSTGVRQAFAWALACLVWFVWEEDVADREIRCV